jgi:hypothetical protein
VNLLKLIGWTISYEKKIRREISGESLSMMGEVWVSQRHSFRIKARGSKRRELKGKKKYYGPS